MFFTAPISAIDGAGYVLALLLSLNPRDLDRIEKCLATVKDWETLLTDTERHGVLGLLASDLMTTSHRLPPEILLDLRRRAVVQRLAQSILHRSLDEVFSAFAVAKVEVLPLKGPILGARLYGDPTLRVSTDLDFMVRREKVPAATAALNGLGFQGVPEPGAQQGWDYQHHITFHRSHSPPVELHFRLVADFGVVIPAEEFLARAQPYQTNSGLACRVLSAEDELLFLVLHAAGHLFARLAWLNDVKALLRLRPDLDFRVVAERAERFRLGRAFGFAMSHIARRMEITLPEGAIRANIHGSRRAALTAILAAEPRFSGRRAKILGHMFRTLLCDSPSLAAKYIGNHLHRVTRR